MYGSPFLTQKKKKVIATFYLKNQSFFLAILAFFLRIVRYKLNSENISVFFSCNYEFISRNSEKKVIKPELWDKNSQ